MGDWADLPDLHNPINQSDGATIGIRLHRIYSSRVASPDYSEEEIADYTRAIELAPEHSGFWFDRGFAFQCWQRYREAISDYSRCLDLQPDDEIAWYHRGVCFHELRDYDRAIADLTQAITLDEADGRSWYGRHLSHMAAGNAREAATDLARSKELGYEPDEL